MKRSFEEFKQELSELSMLEEVRRICRNRFVRLEDLYNTTNRSKPVSTARRDVYRMLHGYNWSPPAIARVFGGDQSAIRRLIRVAPYGQDPRLERRILRILEDRCASFSLDDDSDRRATARILAEELNL